MVNIQGRYFFPCSVDFIHPVGLYLYIHQQLVLLDVKTETRVKYFNTKHTQSGNRYPNSKLTRFKKICFAAILSPKINYAI